MVELGPDQPNRTSELGDKLDRPIGDFSAEDLIRQRVAAPEVFDEPVTPGSNDVVIAAPTVRGEVDAIESNTWSLSLNPFSYLTGRGNASTQQRNVNNNRVESVTEEGCAPPQCSSTPK